MAIPVLHNLSSPELEHGHPPADPRSCAVPMTAELGPARGGADRFHLVVVTPDRRLDGAPLRRGRGYLVMAEFSWAAVEDALRRLLMHADRPRWEDAARELAKEPLQLSSSVRR